MRVIATSMRKSPILSETESSLASCPTRYDGALPLYRSILLLMLLESSDPSETVTTVRASDTYASMRFPSSVLTIRYVLDLPLFSYMTALSRRNDSKSESLEHLKERR